MMLLESLLKIVVKFLLLIVGWPVGMLVLKLISLGKAKRFQTVDSEEDELPSAFWLYKRDTDGSLKIDDLTAAKFGAGIIVIVFWGWHGFPLPQFL